MTTRGTAQCPICRYTQKLRQDGTLGKHHTWREGRYEGVCPGTGRRPRSTA